jgi:hypothetical protein
MCSPLHMLKVLLILASSRSLQKVTHFSTASTEHEGLTMPIVEVDSSGALHMGSRVMGVAPTLSRHTLRHWAALVTSVVRLVQSYFEYYLIR